MDDDGRVAVRRRLICDHAALKLLKAIAERDAAILERNNALAERKAARVERDAALLRCDLAFAERDSALVERDAAVAALTAARAGRFTTFGDWNRHVPSNVGSTKALQAPPVTDSCSFDVDVQSVPACQWKGQLSRSGLCSELFQKSGVVGNMKDIQRDLRVKRKFGKDLKHGLLPPRKRSPEQKSLGHQLDCLDKDEHGISGAEEVDGSFSNSFPYCSCTGVNQPCYKWGNGGWQSACCTTMISMYPLPMNPKKRSSRLAGRKMSAGAFEKLLEKLSSEGVNIKCPIDLKDHWAKHGTNRYVTLR
ncbi:unnamed protein product [Calypogeia fissa]